MEEPSVDEWKAVLRLDGVVSGDRHGAMTRVRQAFQDAGAWITDVHFFSGLQTTFSFEVAPERASDLLGAWLRASVVLDAESQAKLKRAVGAPVEAVRGTLALTFRDGDSALRHEVPRVPG